MFLILPNNFLNIDQCGIGKRTLLFFSHFVVLPGFLVLGSVSFFSVKLFIFFDVWFVPLICLFIISFSHFFPIFLKFELHLIVFCKALYFFLRALSVFLVHLLSFLFYHVFCAKLQVSIFCFLLFLSFIFYLKHPFLSHLISFINLKCFLLK